MAETNLGTNYLRLIPHQNVIFYINAWRLKKVTKSANIHAWRLILRSCHFDTGKSELLLRKI